MGKVADLLERGETREEIPVGPKYGPHAVWRPEEAHRWVLYVHDVPRAIVKREHTFGDGKPLGWSARVGIQCSGTIQASPENPAHPAAMLQAMQWAEELLHLHGWDDPTPEELASPVFEAIWQVIKSWDVSAPGSEESGMYTKAEGQHAARILRAIRPVILKAAEEDKARAQAGHAYPVQALSQYPTCPVQGCLQRRGHRGACDEPELRTPAHGLLDL